MAVIARRRRRRPRWVLIAVMVTVTAVALQAYASRRSSEPTQRVESLTYLDAVRGAIEESTRVGADIVDLRAEAANLGRVAIDRRLERDVREARLALAEVRRAEPPERLTEAHNLLLAALHLRATAVMSVRDALRTALGRQPAEQAVQQLARAAADVVAADRVYDAFLDGLRARVAPDALMPPSRWIAEPETWTPPEMAAFVTALRASKTLAPIHDLAIVVVTTDPAPVRNEGETAVIPATRTLRLQIVVANVGNEPETNVKVEAVLAPAGPKNGARDFVSLEPGQRATITLGGIQPLVGQPAILAVRVEPRPDEASPLDNERRLPLIMR